MSKVRTHRMAALLVDRMADRRVPKVRKAYTDKVLSPLRSIVDAVEPTGDDAADAARLLEATAGVLESIDNDGLVEDLTAHLMQTAAIGAASAPVPAGEEKPPAEAIAE